MCASYCTFVIDVFPSVRSTSSSGFKSIGIFANAILFLPVVSSPIGTATNGFFKSGPLSTYPPLFRTIDGGFGRFRAGFDLLSDVAAVCERVTGRVRGAGKLSKRSYLSSEVSNSLSQIALDRIVSTGNAVSVISCSCTSVVWRSC